MSVSRPAGRATLVGSYRNMSVREIRARLEEPLADVERVTAQAELLRRGADDGGPDTTFVSGYAPTGTMDMGAVESEPSPEMLAQAGVGGGDSEPLQPSRPSRRPWPAVALLALVVAGALGWAVRAGLIGR
jgi:hypothetical protein